MLEAVEESTWESKFFEFFRQREETKEDAAHDLGHFVRVAKLARLIAKKEEKEVDQLVLLAAAYFHDIVNLAKNHPDRKKASYYSSIKAQEILTQMQFPQGKLEAVSHAILTHSFSLGLTPETLEAQVIQDADRLEALGALGVMRCFYTSGKLGALPFHPDDLHGKHRPLDDKKYALDHFYQKLLKLPDQLGTTGGKEIGCKRAIFLKTFIQRLEKDIQQESGEALSVAMLCHKGGIGAKQFFLFQDPFAEHRTLEPERFILDQCLLNLSFDSFFLKELKKELYLGESVFQSYNL